MKTELKSKIENVNALNEKKQIQNSVNLTEKMKVVKSISKEEVERGKKAKDVSLNEITEKLKNLQISDKYKKTKSFVYKFQLSEKIEEVEQKKKRNQIRRTLERLTQNCLLECKRFYELKTSKTKDVLNASFQDFVLFIKENYIVENIFSQINFLSLETKKQSNIFILQEFLKHEIESKNDKFIDFLKKNQIVHE